MDNQKSLKIRDETTKNVFIIICWGWLQDMKILEPNTVFHDLVFSKWSQPHSLTRRLGIALQCIECQNSDATKILADRFRRYWKNHRAFDDQVFGQEKPVLRLPPAPYELPKFSLNDPYPVPGARPENIGEQNGATTKSVHIKLVKSQQIIDNHVIYV